MKKFDKLLTRLQTMAAGANVSCSDFTELLVDFKFDVRPATKGGHRVVSHPAFTLTVAESANYNCGHNPGTHVRRNYVKNFLKIVQTHESEITEFLENDF